MVVRGGNKASKGRSHINLIARITVQLVNNKQTKNNWKKKKLSHTKKASKGKSHINLMARKTVQLVNNKQTKNNG